MSHKAHGEMLSIAIKRGSSQRRDRRIELHGTYSPRMSFAGPSHSFDGRMYCFSYGSKILAVNFTEGLITARDSNHQKIQREIRHWTHTIFEMFNLHNAWYYAFWSSEEIHKNPFAARMPWCRRIDNVNWFHWPSYKADRAEEYFLSHTDLGYRQNWRWFTYRWDDENQWSRQFIDKDAERRWRARERKKSNDLQRGVHGTSP
jgi:hypothetical protein